MECNGWKNRETWLVNLWFGDFFANDAEDGVDVTAEHIREYVEQYVDEIVPACSFVADMMDMRAIDWDALAAHYAKTNDAHEPCVRVMPPTDDLKLDATALNDTNFMELRVFANDTHGHAVLMARLDNLGKGASGAAVQNIQLMLQH